ncbi:DNA primase [Falsibacillus pallidus]|uniref:DNA primase n=1 Tax=Falsibacillus pallidus TaxID=493781 RepID=A0A370GPW5_9BACI|nr:DNA primase [Falsibacillus pallidus]RDI43993.1 DNA primase [Falsibacillus pallidus]
MAGRIPEETINQIKQSVDIVDVISEYVQLKKQGRNYFGLCPFHGENSPSFSVSPEKQIFHCFGCGTGGNAFSFLMDIEGVSFQEAIAMAAEKGNIPFEINLEAHKEQRKLPPDQQQMIEAHELLRKFYHHLLLNTKEGQEALEYLLNRGFTKESIEKYQIGWSLPNWDFSVKFLQKRGYSLSLMEKAGLIIKRDSSEEYFDRFRNRIMFPLWDHKGNTIAFSGRAFGQDEPKYLNSPETVLFNKSKTLYNFHHARAPIRKLQKAVLFEGFADVIASDRAGVANGIATMGTSLTDEHIRILKRITDTVTVCYDSDSAGIEAAFRASNLLANNGFNIEVAQMPDKMDPDDHIKKYGGEKFRNDVLGNCMTFMSFKMFYYRLGKNLSNEGERLQYIEMLLNEISALDKAVERDHYLRQLADEFSLSLEALKQQQQQIFFSRKKNEKNNGPQAMVKRPAVIPTSNKLMPAHLAAEKRLIAHMLKNADTAFKVKDMLGNTPLNIDEHQAIITYLLGYYEQGNQPDSSLFISYLPDEKLRRTITEIEMMSINPEISIQELEDYINQVFKHQKMLKIKEKINEEKEAERQKDYKRAAAIAMEIIQLRKSL